MEAHEEKSMTTEALIRELPKGLIKWYQFNSGKRALYISWESGESDSVEEALRECGLELDVCAVQALDEMSMSDVENLSATYDYIVLVGALERSRNPRQMLGILRKSLAETGKLLLGADNRLGIRYFCGDRDAFTQRSFDGVENYVRINATDRGQLAGRAYAKAELVEMLKKAGFLKSRFYSVLPEVARPQVLFAEDYLPEEELEVRIFPQYNHPDTVFLEEERLYTTLIQNGLFHAMANGYFVECPLQEDYANAKQVTMSLERGTENAMFTIIRRDGKVEKKPAYSNGQEKVNDLLENNRYLQDRGIKMVSAQIEGTSYVMPYVKGEAATDYFRRLLRENQELFLQELDRLWMLIVNSSEHVAYEEIKWDEFEPGWQERKADDPGREKWRKVAFGTEAERENLGVILKRGYIDLVSLNCFYIDGDFVFYDQERYVENLPANVILYRTIWTIYRWNAELNARLPMSQVLSRYHLEEYQGLWERFISCFMNQFRNDTKLAAYHREHRRDYGVINSNRQRMNYSADEYERLFRDIFHGTEGRKIYLFGSGNFTKKFLSQFGEDVEVTGILDNNAARWGMELEGITISSPECVNALPIGSYKVIVCIKNYVPVLKQLREMGVRDYAVYDSNLKYPRKEKIVQPTEQNATQLPKKYHVGYIAGVFDLFHVGHLNMFKRAKEQCDYLIVGVVSDENVRNAKKTTPYIPFEERIELVRSCRYVDEAVMIPAEYSDTDEAYRRYQFDVQFSGSDYAENPAWLAKKAFLQKQGADMVFFPYTQSTSSTKLKALIEKGLI